MTGLTGAVRYMAPENGLQLPYNTSADVYSFGMVLWFIMALEPPFSCYTQEMLPKRVFQKGHRPAIMSKWTEEMSNLIKSCWDADLHQRPDCQAIQENLREQILTIAPDAAISLEQDESIRSSASSLRPKAALSA